jgi:hypothetical protein
MKWTYGYDQRDRKCIQNISGETSPKICTLNTKQKIILKYILGRFLVQKGKSFSVLN